MAIDDCEHTFSELEREVFPHYMTHLRRKMEQPIPMTSFDTPRVGPVALLQQLRIAEDFKGCYVLLDGGRPIYVGISRGVLGRLRQHVRGKTHFDASLAYRIAATHHPHTMKRGDAMADPAFRLRFAERQTYLRGLDAAFVEITNPLERYLFEAYCAMELDTSEWNTFETH